LVECLPKDWKGNIGQEHKGKSVCAAVAYPFLVKMSVANRIGRKGKGVCNRKRKERSRSVQGAFKVYHLKKKKKKKKVCCDAKMQCKWHIAR
jgi:hypothetical protein